MNLLFCAHHEELQYISADALVASSLVEGTPAQLRDICVQDTDEIEVEQCAKKANIICSHCSALLDCIDKYSTRQLQSTRKWKCKPKTLYTINISIVTNVKRKIPLNSCKSGI